MWTTILSLVKSFFVAVAAMATRLPGASNARAKCELGWEPRWPTWRTGFREAPR